VRLQQARYDEAILHLKTAIDISENPDTSKYIHNSGAAHCLMAQVLEKQKASNTQALSHWQKCVDLGSVSNPDEDGW
jgi:hypothetical protein